MSDELNKMERALAQITAPVTARRRDLPPEAQQLRDAWLAFGQLLEAAQAPAAPPVERPPVPRPSRSRRPLIVAAAVAASLLVAVGVYWACCGPGGSAVVPVAPDKMAASPVQNQNKAVTSNHIVRQSTAAAGELKWDDKLDEQIRQTAQAATLAQIDGLRGVDAFDAMGYQIEETKQDFEKNEL
jgi:hypothetical protein